jgi:hypothetical protein
MSSVHERNGPQELAVGSHPGHHVLGQTAGAERLLRSFLAASINDNGIMVGGPSIDTSGTVQDLNTLIPAGSPYQIQNADDNGQILANTTSNHALLLTPS